MTRMRTQGLLGSEPLYLGRRLSAIKYRQILGFVRPADRHILCGTPDRLFHRRQAVYGLVATAPRVMTACDFAARMSPDGLRCITCKSAVRLPARDVRRHGLRLILC